jgi:hypothetical protein
LGRDKAAGADAAPAGVVASKTVNAHAAMQVFPNMDMTGLG